MIGLTTFVSLIVGELVPKQFALRAPEAIAATMAPAMRWLAVGTAPIVWLLDSTSAGIFRLIGLNRESEEHVTAEELQLIVAEASKSGVIEEHERSIISGVVRLADRPVREVMDAAQPDRLGRPYPRRGRYPRCAAGDVAQPAAGR